MLTYRSRLTVDAHAYTHIDLICVYLSIYDVNDMAINPTPKIRGNKLRLLLFLCMCVCFNSDRYLFVRVTFTSVYLCCVHIIFMQNRLLSLPVIMSIVSMKILQASSNRRYDLMHTIINVIFFNSNRARLHHISKIIFSNNSNGKRTRCD